MKIDPYKFTKKEKPSTSLRPALTGVHYSKGSIEASDGSVAVRFKSPYPKANEGKIITKDGITVDAKFPNMDLIIPDKRDLVPYQVNVSDLERTYRGAMATNRQILKDAGHGSRYKLQEEGRNAIWFRDLSDPEPKDGFAMSLDVVARLIHYLKAAGTDTIYLYGKQSGKIVNRKAVSCFSDGSFALFMPMMYDDPDMLKYRAEMVPQYWRRQTSAQDPARKKAAAGKRKPSPAQKPTTTSKTRTKTQSTMTRKRTTTKAHRSANTTMREASRILKSQKEDYQKIFRSEVKKSKDPKKGAKKAGKIYRDRYGNTATARWKRAVRKANLPTW